MAQNTFITDELAVLGSIGAQSATTGSLSSNWAYLGTTEFLLAVLNLGAITGTCDLAIEQAYQSLTVSGQTTTASASASATTLVVSGGVYATNDFVTADGVNFVRVTAPLSGAGNLSVTALPAAVASGAAILAITGKSTVATLSAGPASGTLPTVTQTPALASAAGIYTLEARGISFNGNTPALAGDGTAMGYNPNRFVRITSTLAVGSTSAVLAASLLSEIATQPASAFNAGGVVVNQIKA